MDGAYVINFDKYESEIHWIALHMNDNNVTYFDSFETEHISKEVKNFIGTKNIKTNIYRVQASDSKIHGL